MLEQQLRLYEAESELLPLQKDLISFEEKYYQSQIKEINAELSSRRETHIESFRRYARSVLEGSPTAEERLIAQNMIKRVDEWLEIARKNRTVEDQLEQSEKQRKVWENSYSNMRNRIQAGGDQGVGGLNSYVGLMLRRQRLELPNTRRLREQLGDYQARMQQIGSLLLELDDWTSQHSTNQTDDEANSELREKESQLITDFRLDANNYFYTWEISPGINKK